MSKRVVAVFFLFSLCMGLLSLRIISIGEGRFSDSAAQNHSKSILLSTTRGMLYDCNGEALVNEETCYFAVAKPSVAALNALKPYVSAEEWAEIGERMQKGNPVVIPVSQPNIDCADIHVVQVQNRYKSEPFAVHLLGYLDAQGSGVTGIEKSYNSFLQEKAGTLSVLFPSDAQGRILTGGITQIENKNYNSKAGLRLTIDRRVQQIVEDVFNGAGIRAGAAVVLDVQNGAIRALLSRPAFSPESVADVLQNADAPLLNRALATSPVGSVFKPILAAAALEQGIVPQTTFQCTGQIQIGDHVFHCHKQAGHGWLDMQGAVANSCNLYFIQLLQGVELAPLLQIVRSAGFGTSTTLAPGLESATGTVPDAAQLQTRGALANFSFGQGTLLATPLQLAACFAVFAGDGQYRPAYVVEGFVDETGALYEKSIPNAAEQVLLPETAEKLRVFLQKTVENGTGKMAKPQKGGAGGKTATAQTGIQDETGERYNVWFAGYFPAQSPKYSIAILLEDGQTGSGDCAPLFRAIADKLAALDESDP